MKPMLAHVYEHKRFKGPAYVQPKLDGIRALTQRGQFFSRDEIMWKPGVLEHIEQHLWGNDTILDGEMYVHGWPLQKINGAVAVKRTIAVVNTPKVAFNVFDSYGPEPFIERYFRAKHIVECINSPSIQLVPVHEADNPEDVDYYFNYYINQGYEGVMVRMGDQGYTLPHQNADKNNRTWTMLKRKGWLDEEFEIIDIVEGREGKHEGTLGAFVLKTPTGKLFNAGSGLSDSERDQFWSNPPIGLKATIQYRMLSLDGIPLNPTIKIVHV